MASKSNNYISMRISWDKFVDDLSNKFFRNYKFIDNKITTRQLNDDIYAFLTKNKFDYKAISFIWKSVKEYQPKLTRKQFLSKYINQPTGNILNEINNAKTTERIRNKLIKTITPLQGRVDRLRGFKRDTSMSGVTKNIWDVERILKTNKTTELHLREKVSELKRVLTRTTLTSDMRRDISRDIKEFNKQLTITQRSNKSLDDAYRKFNSNYKNYDSKKLSSEYSKLLNRIETDIIYNQQRVAIDRAMRSSASYQVKRVANTEFNKNKTQENYNVLHNKQNKLSKGRKLLVKYELSANHAIIDICDDYARADVGYGRGIYPLDYAPMPISDTHSNCSCALSSVRDIDVEDIIDTDSIVDEIYNTNFPSKEGFNRSSNQWRPTKDNN